MRLQKLYEDTMCAGIMYRVPWGLVTPEEKELLTECIYKVNKVMFGGSRIEADKCHKKILKILKKYEGKEV